MSDLPPRIRELVEGHLIGPYWDAVKHFGSRDLVIFFNEEEDEPLSIATRQSLLAKPGLPTALRGKLAKPASDAAVQLKSAEATFWLVAMFEDGEAVTVAINSKLVAPGGTA